MEQKCMPWFVLKPWRAFYRRRRWNVEAIDLEKVYTPLLEEIFRHHGKQESPREFWSSQRLLKNSPYVRFLERFKNRTKINEQEFRDTDYYRLAVISIKKYGSLFGITDEKELIKQANYFLGLFHAIEKGLYDSQQREFRKTETCRSVCIHPCVVKLEKWNIYAIKDGNHRLASHYVSGHRFAEASVEYGSSQFLKTIEKDNKVAI